MKNIIKPEIIVSSFDDLENPYYGGGGAVAIFEVFKRLNIDYKITVITGKYPGSKNKFIEGIYYKRIGSNVFGPKIGQLIFQFLLPFYVMTMNFDLWIESFTPPFSTAFLPIFTKKPVIGLVHMLAAEDMWRKYIIPFQIIENIGLKYYRNFIVLTEETKRKILKYNRNASIDVIPAGINLPKFRNSSETSKKYFLYIGRIEINQKGLDLLLKAFKKVAENVNYELLVAGSGDKKEVNKFKGMIHNFGLDSKVKLIGRVKGVKKDEIMSKARAIIIPSRFENFSLVALEALSYKVPIICFNIEGLHWLPDNLCFKVESFDVDNLAETLVIVTNSNSKVNWIKKNSKKFINRYTWDSIAKLYKNKIEGLIKISDFNNSVLRHIINKKIKCYFISPHFDDAIYSAGNLITYLAYKTDVNVVNVFTKICEGPETFSSKVFTYKCGYQNTRELYSDRKKEDKLILENIGVKVTNLNFIEALWRKKSIKNLPDFITKIFPEIIHVYPTYRYNVVGGKVSIHDKSLLKKLENKLRKIIKNNNCYVFCPIAIGKHVDHIIVNNICIKLFKNIIFWSDYPYNLAESIYSLDLHGKKIRSFYYEKNKIKKTQLIKKYKTQLKASFPMGKIELVPEQYYLSL